MEEETRSSNPSDGFTFLLSMRLLLLIAATVARSSDFSLRGTSPSRFALRCSMQVRVLHIHRCTRCVCVPPPLPFTWIRPSAKETFHNGETYIKAGGRQ